MTRYQTPIAHQDFQNHLRVQQEAAATRQQQFAARRQETFNPGEEANSPRQAAWQRGSEDFNNKRGQR